MCTGQLLKEVLGSGNYYPQHLQYAGMFVFPASLEKKSTGGHDSLIWFPNQMGHDLQFEKHWFRAEVL